MMRAIQMVAVVAVFCGMVGRSFGSPITVIDQQNLVGGSTPGPQTIGTGPGQSFTPTLTQIDAAEFSLLSTGTTTTARLDVFDGAGFGGTLLGSSGSVVFSNTSYAMIHFDLLSSIPLTPGNLYTLRPVYIGDDDFRVEFGASNPYSGGDAYDPDGNIGPGVDFVFSEGLHDAAEPIAIPEPSTLALLGFGAIGLGIRARRRKTA